MKIAYLAPEIPGLSSTFVNNEIIWLEASGQQVVPISIHKPDPHNNPGNLASRTKYLYDAGPLVFLLSTLLLLLNSPRRCLRTAKLVVSDILATRIPFVTRAKLLYQFLAANHLARILHKEDCIHLHIHFMDVPTQVGMYAASLLQIPFTVMAHANDIFDNPILLKQKAKRAYKVVTISEYNKRYLVQHGIPDNKIAIVRCATESSRQDNSLRKQFKPNSSITIGSLGRLVEKKGMDILLASLKHLLDSGFNIRLEIAGTGPLRDVLTKQAHELGIGKHVTFLGALKHEDVPAWLNRLDIFALACRIDDNGDMDGIPVALMEAMAHGIPVVSTHLSGIPELIIHNKTGLLAKPGDYRDLARRIEHMIDNPQNTYTMAGHALHHVENEFGIKTNIDRLASIFADAGIRQSCPAPQGATQ